ncbi:MAG: Uma2 family endonuclease [SAR202 cluster bacterium]|nr:Uma2 family endonuclease [SAR202 cluster bacterium]
MQSPVLKFTYEDYVLLPEGDRRELIGGDFYVVPAPNNKHQEVVGNLYLALRQFLKKHRLGVVMLSPTDVMFSKMDVVQPDLLFIAEDRRTILTGSKVEGAPDLIIEVLSLGTVGRDRKLKLDLYARYGVKEYWMVDPEKETVQVLQLGPRGKESLRTFTSGNVASTIINGFEMPVEEIFVRS